MKNIILLAVLLVSTTLSYGSAWAECHLPIKTPFLAVPLFKDNYTGRLENENRLREICPTLDQVCVNEALSAQIDRMPIYDHPSGKVIANLEVRYKPGDGITAALVTQDGKSYPFTPPIYDNDWGYGPYFHATLLDQNESWKKIVLPSIQSGWVELPDVQILNLTESGSVYSLNNHHIMILRSDKTSITVRDEQPADMDCGEGNPPPLATFNEQVIPLSGVYDDQCNLLIKPAYTRGC